MTKKELKAKQLKDIESKLRSFHPAFDEQWFLWCKKEKSEAEREEVAIGAILTQRANWENVETAIANLKNAGILSLEKIAASSLEDLADLIKPAGCYNTKARYLSEMAKRVIARYGTVSAMMEEEIVILRQDLLGIKGIGFETADSILLYALDKPTFVIDEYTRRLAAEVWPAKAFPDGEKPKNVTKKLYLFLKNFFEDGLEKDFKIYQGYHAKIVIYGKKAGKIDTGKNGKTTGKKAGVRRRSAA